MKIKLFSILLLTSFLYSNESFEELKERSKKDIYKFFHPCGNLSVSKCLAQGNIGPIGAIVGASIIDNSSPFVEITINRLRWDVEKTIKENIPKITISCIELGKNIDKLNTLINDNLLIVNSLKRTDNKEYKDAHKLALTSIIYQSNYDRKNCHLPEELR